MADNLQPGRDTFEESLASKPLVFVVGQGAAQKAFFIHRELIGQLSPVLNVLVNGSMKEAVEGRVEWPDVAVDTFVRFARFAYCGDYKEPEPEARLVQEPGSGSPQSPVWLSSDSEDGIIDELVGEAALAPRRVYTSSNTSDSESESESDSDDSFDEHYMLVLNAATRPRPSGSSGAANAPIPLDNNVAPRAGNRPVYRRQPSRRQGWPHHLPLSVAGSISGWQKHLINKKAEIALASALITDLGRKRRRLNGGGAAARRVDDKAAASACPKNPNYDMFRRFATLVPSKCGYCCATKIMNCSQSYENVLLGHANLYILADKYAVQGLADLALSRLHQNLVWFTIHQRRVPDLLALTRFMYANTMQGDPARAMLSMFFGCVVEYIRHIEEFTALLGACPDFAVDLIHAMTERFD